MKPTHLQALVLWAQAWDSLETAGRVDSWGSVEYFRLLRDWMHQNCPVPVLDWITANHKLAGPQGG